MWRVAGNIFNKQWQKAKKRGDSQYLVLDDKNQNVAQYYSAI
jgi:hypothetical protein